MSAVEAVEFMRKALIASMRSKIAETVAYVRDLRREEEQLGRDPSTGPERHELHLKRRAVAPQTRARLEMLGLLRGRSVTRSGRARAMDAKSERGPSSYEGYLIWNSLVEALEMENDPKWMKGTSIRTRTVSLLQRWVCGEDPEALRPEMLELLLEIVPLARIPLGMESEEVLEARAS